MVVRRFLPWLVPPAIAQRAQYLWHRVFGAATVFTGPYNSWASAAAVTRGYNDPKILARVLDATRQVKQNQRRFERDSVLLAEPEYPLAVLAGMLWIAGRMQRLHVVDFGGSLGSTYFQLRPFLQSLKEVHWSVVEQRHFVDAGTREIADLQLSFSETVTEALRKNDSDVLLLSSVLQYLPAPYDFLRDLKQYKFRYIIIDRTPFHLEPIDWVVVQRNSRSFDRSSYPMWLFNERKLLAELLGNYEMIYSFDAIDRAIAWRGNIDYKGFVFGPPSS